MQVKKHISNKSQEHHEIHTNGAQLPQLAVYLLWHCLGALRLGRRGGVRYAAIIIGAISIGVGTQRLLIVLVADGTLLTVLL